MWRNIAIPGKLSLSIRWTTRDRSAPPAAPQEAGVFIINYNYNKKI
jgi:hypothetical protein